MTLFFLFIQLAVQMLGADTWGANGHRIVAHICDLHLTDTAKKGVKEILGDEFIEEAANWPDYIKSENGWRFANEWHYTTVDEDKTIMDIRKVYGEDTKINDALEAMDLMLSILNDDKEATAYLEGLMDKNRAQPLNNSTKATALAFLVHLVGDIHQPMHVGKNKDQGGNKISVLFFDERTNVHSVWDSDIIEHERLSYTEFSRFINKLSPSEIAALQDDPIDEWARESIKVREHIYDTIYDYTDRDSGLPDFSWNYQHDNIPIVEERLVTAGVRLAGILNELFD